MKKTVVKSFLSLRVLFLCSVVCASVGFIGCSGSPDSDQGKSATAAPASTSDAGGAAGTSQKQADTSVKQAAPMESAGGKLKPLNGP